MLLLEDWRGQWCGVGQALQGGWVGTMIAVDSCITAAAYALTACDNTALERHNVVTHSPGCDLRQPLVVTHRLTRVCGVCHQVTMLFSDIVGFTELCAEWRTELIVEMLDALFSRFDELCDK